MSVEINGDFRGKDGNRALLFDHGTSVSKQLRLPLPLTLAIYPASHSYIAILQETRSKM